MGGVSQIKQLNFNVQFIILLVFTMEIGSALKITTKMIGEPVKEKRIVTTQEISSPKFARKRGEGTNVFQRKTEKNVDPVEHLTFISPKKYIDQYNHGTDSFRSIPSIACLHNKDLYKKQQKTLGSVQQADVLSLASGVSLSSMQSLPSIQNFDATLTWKGGCNGSVKNLDIKMFQTAEEIRQKARATQELTQIKSANDNLNKKVIQLGDRIKELRQQNSYLFKKIDSFNDLIAEKNEIINQMSHLLKEKQQKLEVSNQDIIDLKKSNEQLENVIALLKQAPQTTQDCNQKCNCTNTTKDDQQTLTPPSDSENNKLKFQLEEMSNKLKYIQLQESMYQKLRYDLNLQIDKNQALKEQNRKLLMRVEVLVARETKKKQTGKKNLPDRSLKEQRSAVWNRGSTRRESQVSLELSPEK